MRDIEISVMAGDVLSAEETREEMATLVQRPALSGVALSFTLPAADADSLEDPHSGRATRFTLAPGPCGVMHAIVTLQAGPHLVRVLVPLVCARAEAWLESVCQQGGTVLLADIPTTQQLTAIVVPLPIMDADVIRTIAARGRRVEGLALAQDVAAVTKALLSLEPLGGSLTGVPVEKLCVVVAGQEALDAVIKFSTSTRH